MAYETKVLHYRAGAYLFDPALLPTQAHTHWTERDWIDFIDLTGRWTRL